MSNVTFIKNLFILTIICLILPFANTSAQNMKAGIGIGKSIYWGDLNASGISENLNNGGLAIQGLMTYPVNHYFNIRGNIVFGKLSGDDARADEEWQRQRNLSFESSFTELSLLGEFHFLSYFSEAERFSPYFAGGAGAFFFNPTTEYNGATYELQPLGTEGQGGEGFPDKYSKTAFSLVLGGGFKFRLTDKIILGVEISGRRSSTDYIDDVSTNYVNYAELREINGEIAAALGNREAEYLGLTEPVMVETGTKRGGADQKDYYYTGMINLIFDLGDSFSFFGKGRSFNSVNCPSF